MTDENLKDKFSRIDPMSMIKRENGEQGISVPVEFTKYGLYRGASELEFYCSIHTINDDDGCELTDKQIAGLENNSIDIDSLPVDDFNFERVEKYDFDTQEWLKHSDMSVVNSQDFCYYGDFNEFASDIIAEAERRGALPNAPQADRADQYEPEV